MPEQSRSRIDSHNGLVFLALAVSFVLTFFDENTLLLGVEMVFRAVVIALVAAGLLRWRRGYFAHWTSYLAVVIGAICAVRIFSVLSGGVA